MYWQSIEVFPTAGYPTTQNFMMMSCYIFKGDYYIYVFGLLSEYIAIFISICLMGGAIGKVSCFYWAYIVPGGLIITVRRFILLFILVYSLWNGP